MRGSRKSAAFQSLLATAGRLKFQPHRIAHLLDARGRHELKLPEGFPFAVSLFHFRKGATTQRTTWHERLELLVPLDGPLKERMGDLVAELQAGDVLVVDHLKPHQVVDSPGLNTRAVVISFLAKCVFSAGSPPTDYAFLIPFHRRVEGRPHVMRAGSLHAGQAHAAINELLRAYFSQESIHRETACKAWLLVLLNALILEFRDSALDRVRLLRREEQAARLKPVFDHVREHYARRLPVADAAARCGMTPAKFRRVFREVSGMTLANYFNHVRMTHAVELLEETNEPIAGIALQLGFSDQSHFDRRFRRTFGRTPSHHRGALKQARRPV
ncbi:MAG TPA: hypothetical protein DCY13_16485 [Verrucomicrobiales bacterium]|nr:hypothetical protein [Verrucomicrobiales bacterium]